MITGYFIFGYDEAVIRKYLVHPNYLFVITKRTKDDPTIPIPIDFREYSLFKLLIFTSGNINSLRQSIFEWYDDFLAIDDWEFIFLENDSFYTDTIYDVICECMKHFVIRVQTDYSINYNFVYNIVKNLPYYSNGYSINELRGSLKDKTVVLCGAGPSLYENLNELKSIQNKVCIFAASRTIKPLLDYGILPDFNFIVDYSELTLPFAKGIDKASSIPLITDAMVYCEVLREYPGPIFFMRCLRSDSLIGRHDNHFDLIPTGGTVTSFAFSFALYCHAKSIILLGCDLSFPNISEGSSEYGFTYKPDELNKINSDIRLGKYLKVKNNVGGYNLTDSRMYTYIKDFEYMIHSSPKTKVYNASSRGAMIEGTIPLELCKLSFNREVSKKPMKFKKKDVDVINWNCYLEKIDIFKEVIVKNYDSLKEVYRRLEKDSSTDVENVVNEFNAFRVKNFDLFNFFCYMSGIMYLHGLRFDLQVGLMGSKEKLDWIGFFYKELLSNIEVLERMIKKSQEPLGYTPSKVSDSLTA